jgi:hypothetical protein
LNVNNGHISGKVMGILRTVTLYLAKRIYVSI